MIKDTLRADILSIQETTTITNTGYVFSGSTNDSSETGNPLGNPRIKIPTQKTYCGSSEDKGNTIRSLYNLNTNGPIQFNETLDDRKQILTKYANYVVSNAALVDYPYLYPLTITEERSARTQSAIDLSLTRLDSHQIYKCLGKGLGEIHFMCAGAAVEVTDGGDGTGGVYAFDGYLYSGTLVQLQQETDLTTGIIKTTVIPYQNGRGIPNYSTNYCPPSALTTNSYPPFGEYTEGVTATIAPGIEAGQGNTCFGMVLDTYSTTPQTRTGRRQFIYRTPEGNTQTTPNDSDEFYNHPAPHTIPAMSFENDSTIPKTQGFMSPGPNQSGVYFSPWPRYYTYQPGDPVPVLTKGITTARIGAAYNIALMTYGIATQVSATDEIWVPVQCIPLFEGERIEAGSYIYAAVKGHNVTPGSYQDIAASTLGDNSQFVTEGILGQTPWDHFVDSTYGNFGWTGTPGLSFSNIPDTTVTILETTPDENGIEKKIPNIHQANQGSIIVHPITSVSPSPAIGNAYLQSEIELTTQNLTVAEVEAIELQRRNLPGISGRCVLSQTNPEKAQPIGILLETIIGTGRWTYTGQPTEPDTVSLTGTLVTATTGGAVYGNPEVLLTTPLRGGTDTGKEGLWVTNVSSSPSLGTLTGTITETVVGGPGYLVGDILTFQDDSLTFTVPQYKSNNAAVELTSLGPPGILVLYGNGSNYTSLSAVTTFNLTLNSGYFQFETVLGEVFPIGVIANPLVYYQDLFTYIPGYTIISVLADTVVSQDQGYFTFSDYPDSISQNLTTITNGLNYPVIGASYFETEIVDYNKFSCLVDIVVTTTPEITIIDYGSGNQIGDKILILSGDNNIVFDFPGIPLGYQELISGVPNYTSGTYETYDPLTGTLADLTVTTTSQTTTLTTENVSVVFLIDTVGVVATGDYNLRYSGGFTVNPTPWYHCNRQGIYYSVGLPEELYKLRGGTNYTTATGVMCYNLTANSLRIICEIQNEVIRSYPTGLGLYTDVNYQFNESRYSFSLTDGSSVRIMHDLIPKEKQEIIQLVSFESNELEVSLVNAGGLYKGVADGLTVFQTERIDYTAPTVDIVVEAGRIRRVRLNTLGNGNQNGDLILITQSGTDTDNAVFIFNDNMPTIDLPPYATSTKPNYKVETDSDAWQRYSDVMNTATNLLDKQVLIELRPMNDQTMENITPYGFIGGSNAPPTENIYKTQTI